MEYMTFPWEQIGSLLRALSLSGGPGNAVAWLLFLALGLCPAAGLGALLYGQRAVRADWLLALLSALLLAGMWFFVNPTYLEKYLFAAGMGERGKYAFALTIDSAALTWVLLRFLRGYERRERRRLFQELQAVLGLYVLLMATGTFLGGVEEFIRKYAAIKSGNTPIDPERLSFSAVFLFLQIFCSLLPELLEIALWVVVLALLHGGERDGFSADSLKKVELLKKLSARFLAVILFGNLSVNLLQLSLGRWIYSSQFSIVFPLREAVVMLGVLILSRFYLESRRLKEDNDLFI